MGRLLSEKLTELAQVCELTVSQRNTIEEAIIVAEKQEALNKYWAAKEEFLEQKDKLFREEMIEEENANWGIDEVYYKIIGETEDELEVYENIVKPNNPWK